MKLTVLAVIVGFLLDCILGDPASLPHPIILIGKGISLFEKKIRPRFPKTEKGELAAGAVLAAVIPIATGLVTFLILFIACKINKWLYFALCCIMCWQILAARCLQKEAKKVYDVLLTGDIVKARQQVSYLVGRDTQNLTSEQVIKATVETVAENTSDGVIAPMFWMMLFGPVGGFMYKAVNTMDSMVGYKHDKYLYFGRCAAKLDDVVNYIPARLSGLGMILAAAITGEDGKNAFRIWRRDRRKHASPNSAQTESVCAGALHIQLAGNASYFGKVYEKPFIGDFDRPVENKDILRSCKLMYGTGVLLLIVFSIIVFLAAWAV